MKYLTENQILAITLLTKYKYLTSSQFVKLGVFKKRGYLTNALKSLLDAKQPLIAKHDFNPLNGKLESLYYLTKYGVKFLIEELDYSEKDIKVPKGLLKVYPRDYFHRKATIDFNISLQQWLLKENGTIVFLNYYFDKVGNNREDNKDKDKVTALNKIILKDGSSFSPDINAIFKINGKESIVLFEHHDGVDTKRLYDQLLVHITAIADNVVSGKYNYTNKPHKVVVVCEFESVKNSVIKNLQKIDGIEHYNKFFIFKTSAELEIDFYNNWTLISGEQDSPFQKLHK
jgi:hypothetical protein